MGDGNIIIFSVENIDQFTFKFVTHLNSDASLTGLKWKDERNILHPDVRFDVKDGGTALHLFAEVGMSKFNIHENDGHQKFQIEMHRLRLSEVSQISARLWI